MQPVEVTQQLIQFHRPQRMCPKVNQQLSHAPDYRSVEDVVAVVIKAVHFLGLQPSFFALPKFKHIYFLILYPSRHSVMYFCQRVICFYILIVVIVQKDAILD